MYFETPDLQKPSGWNNIGGVNHYQLAALRGFVGHREAGSLKTLLADDTRLQNSRTALDAYAESWALNYFLIRQRPKQYLEYIKLLSKKPRFGQDGPDVRLRKFQQIFGENLQQLDTEFIALHEQGPLSLLPLWPAKCDLLRTAIAGLRGAAFRPFLWLALLVSRVSVQCGT